MKRVTLWVGVVVASFWAMSSGHGQTIPPVVYLPIVANAPAPTPTPVLDWDPRLDQRGAYLISSAGAWRLVSARWLDEAESGGRHHIYIDTVDADGKRVIGVPVVIRWDGGSAIVTTETKPNEPFAANFAMYAVAPAYSAQPVNGDGVGGMGLGSIEQPKFKIHTSYELIWQWIPGDDYAR